MEQVGAGAMAVVFRAYDERLSRQVALKVLAPALTADEAFRERFTRESRAASAVDDPHIIPVYEAGEAGGVLFIAMRYVGGGDVRSLMQRESPLSPARATAIISSVASALDAAHGAGLVHRDVKPANMLLDVRPGRPDHVYLSDFGLSKGVLPSAGLTGTDVILGTPDYISPEQIAGGLVDGRADQYALACAAFELLSGAPPFQRDHDMAVMYAHSAEPPPALSSRRPELPSAVDAVMARALAKEPAHRYASCQQFTTSLAAALQLPQYRLSRGSSHSKHERTRAKSVLSETRGPAEDQPSSAAVSASSVVQSVSSRPPSAAPSRKPRQVTTSGAPDAGPDTDGKHAGPRRRRLTTLKKARKAWIAVICAAAAVGTLIGYAALSSHVAKPGSSPHSASNSPARASQPSIWSRRYHLSSYLTSAMALGGRHLWVVYMSGWGQGFVIELNASNGQLIRTLSYRKYHFGYPGGIAIGGGHVWVTDADMPRSGAGPGWVTELDASSGRLIRNLSSPSYGFDGPSQVAVGGGHVWVTNYQSNSVTEVDASSGRLVQVLSGGSYGFDQPEGIAVGGGHVWVVNSANNTQYGFPSVTELDASSGRWVQTLSGRRYGFSAPAGVAVDASHVWVANANAKSNALIELDASSGRLVQKLISHGSGLPGGFSNIAVDGAHVWLTGGSIEEFNASNGSWMRTLSGNRFNSPGPIVADRNHVWVMCRGRTLTEFPAR